MKKLKLLLFLPLFAALGCPSRFSSNCSTALGDGQYNRTLAHADLKMAKFQRTIHHTIDRQQAREPNRLREGLQSLC